MCHLFFAAGAFCQKKRPTNHETYETYWKNMNIILNISSILCRRRLFVKELMKKHENN